ncbi:hypothetical protein L596_005244 [Steinernema carpocapsae]|uniref:Uncharacterized protein n=1 Tax=Steinernema carpocapsae TaxID=34508 RepID=A0A4U8UYM8_STECR|nr:hypothetical protein L596_005244 [Steinernema carpocapsae]
MDSPSNPMVKQLPLLTTTAKEEEGLATAPRFEDAFVTPTVVPTDGQAAPLLTTTAEEEEGLATAPRFEDAFVTPTVVPTDGLTDEEREHIERVMKWPNSLLRTRCYATTDHAGTAPRLELTLIAHLTPIMNSPLRRIIKQLHCSPTTAEEEERLTTAPRFEDAFVTPTVVPTDGLTDEEREHIERVMKMAQQSSFEQGVMQQQTMPEPVEELEPDDRSSATSGADADRSFDAEYGQSFESYGQAAPLLTTTAEEEERLTTAPRFEDAFVTPTVVPTDDHAGTGRRTRACGNLLNQEPQVSFQDDRSSATSGADADRSFDAEYGQSFESYGQAAPLLTTTAKEEEGLATAPRFEDAFVTPTVVPTDGLTDEEREHIERVIENGPTVFFRTRCYARKDHAGNRKTDPAPRLGLTLIAHLTPNMDSPSNPMVKQLHFSQQLPKKRKVATAPRFEDAFVTPTVVPTDGLTDEEREHIERVMKMAQQSSFEQGVMQQKTMPEPVEELEPVEIFVNQEPQVSFQDPRFEDAFVLPLFPTDGLTDEEREHIERVMKMAQQSSFEEGVMQGKTMPEPVEELEPVEIFVDQDLKLASRKTDPAPTSGADADRSFDAEYGQSFESYGRAAPLLTTTAEEEEGLATAPRFEDAFEPYRCSDYDGPTVFFRTRCYARKDHAGTGRRTRACGNLCRPRASSLASRKTDPAPRLGLTLIAHLTLNMDSSSNPMVGQLHFSQQLPKKRKDWLQLLFEDAFVTPTVVPTDDGPTVFFEEGVMQGKTMPEPLASRKTDPAPRLGLTLIAHLTLNMDSPSNPMVGQLHFSQQTAEEEEGLATAPRFEDAFVTPTVVPNDGLTDEEREHIERVMKMAQQSSFEQVLCKERPCRNR